MAEVRWTAAAQKDLVEIGDLIAADNRRAAFAFVEGIRQHCSLLSSTPLMGRPRPEIGARVRSFPHGRYIVFYRYEEQEGCVEILRVWHGRRRPPSLSNL